MTQPSSQGLSSWVRCSYSSQHHFGLRQEPMTWWDNLGSGSVEGSKEDKRERGRNSGHKVLFMPQRRETTAEKCVGLCKLETFPGQDLRNNSLPKITDWILPATYDDKLTLITLKVRFFLRPCAGSKPALRWTMHGYKWLVFSIIHRSPTFPILPCLGNRKKPLGRYTIPAPP